MEEPAAHPPSPSGATSVTDLWSLAEAAFGDDAEAARARVEALRAAELPASASGGGRSTTPPRPFTACPAAVLRALRSLWANLALPPECLDVASIQAGDGAALQAADRFLRAAGKRGEGGPGKAAPWEVASPPRPAATLSAKPGAAAAPWWQALGLGKDARAGGDGGGGGGGGGGGIRAARPAVEVAPPAEAEAPPPPAAAGALSELVDEGVAVDEAAASSPPRPPTDPDAAARSAGLAAAARLAQAREALLASLAAAAPGRAAGDAGAVLMRLQFQLAEAQADLARAAAAAAATAVAGGMDE